jgi:hypothetical protein
MGNTNRSRFKVQGSRCGVVLIATRLFTRNERHGVGEVTLATGAVRCLQPLTMF